MFRHGELFYNGILLKKQKKKKYFQTGNQKDDIGFSLYTNLLYNGDIIPKKKNKYKAVLYYKKAIELRYSYSMKFAKMLETGDLIGEKKKN